MEQKYREMLVPVVLSVSLFALLNNLLGSFIQNIVFYVVYNDLIFRVLNFALNFLCLFASSAYHSDKKTWAMSIPHPAKQTGSYCR